MFRDNLRTSVHHVGVALREPESFAARWQEETQPYSLWVWGALAATSMLGTITYGMTMGMQQGAAEAITRAILCTVAAGLAWGIPLPALYIFNSLNGSRLQASTTLLAVLVTTSWGGLAMIASIPVNVFFNVSLPVILPADWVGRAMLAVNFVVFAGVGVSMVDVFRRVVERLEPQRATAPLWCLALVSTIGIELFYAFGLFDFSAVGV